MADCARTGQTIYWLTSVEAFHGDFGLREQIQRAAVSVMSNIAEGFERGSTKGFIQFLYQAKGSAAEVRPQLYIALDLHYIDQSQFDSALQVCVHASIKVNNLIDYLKTTEFKG